MKKLLLFIILISSCNIETRQSGEEEELDEAYYTPIEVVDYFQAPGFYSKYEEFSIRDNLDKILGFPVGGGSFAPDHSSIVSLGEAGGYVVLKFDPPIENLELYDFIVFGNSFFISGDINQPNIEYGVVEVMKDSNLNNSPDDGWNLLVHPANRDAITPKTITYNKNDYPEDQWTLGSEDSYLVDVWEISNSISYKGFADCNPTLDSDTSNYAIADTPLGDIDSGSGGGDAFDLDWAISSNTLEEVYLDQISWVKISTASYPGKSKFETEVDAVVRVSR